MPLYSWCRGASAALLTLSSYSVHSLHLPHILHPVSLCGAVFRDLDKQGDNGSGFLSPRAVLRGFTTMGVKISDDHWEPFISFVDPSGDGKVRPPECTASRVHCCTPRVHCL